MIKITVILCLISVGLSLAFGYSNQEQVRILRNDREVWDDGYIFDYELSDGQNCYEVGQVVDGDLVVTGSYTYIGLDGLLYFKRYQYVREGFKPSGGHFPLGAGVASYGGGIGGSYGSGIGQSSSFGGGQNQVEPIRDPKLFGSLLGGYAVRAYLVRDGHKIPVVYKFTSNVNLNRRLTSPNQ